MSACEDLRRPLPWRRGALLAVCIGLVCAQLASDPDPRVSIPEALVFDLPFAQKYRVLCVQGNDNASGSHSNRWTRYALDLVSVPGPSVVLAAAPGRVEHVVTDCPGSGLSFWADRCNFGFGNVVWIRHRDNSLAQYAHLGRVYAEVGTEVGRGTPIGVESVTGAAGHPHLHFSVHMPGTGLGASMPFAIRFRDPRAKGRQRELSSTDFPCQRI